MSPDDPVALVIHRRIRDEGFGAYSEWQTRVAERLRSWPGFLGQEVVPPSPPALVDWTVVQRFATATSARDWLASSERERLLEEIRSHFIGEGDVHLLAAQGARPKASASALISFAVAPADEAAFLRWQQRLQAAQAKFPGFLRNRTERPVAGVHEDWLTVSSFDTEAHLNAWLDSPERQTLLKEGAELGVAFSVRRSAHGFDFWFPGQPEAPSSPHGIFKSNLLVLVVLYPLVFLWGFFVSAPFIDSRGAPFWLSLLIGNFVSTQVLGWWLAPKIFQLFAWWMPDGIHARRQVGGYAAVALLLAVSAALCGVLGVYL
ncbi:MAG: antibiotic biosynthesis monooxygenase [Reyranellaceae bacterium]